MVLIGTTFISNYFAASPTPTHSENLTYVAITGGHYSDLYGTNATKYRDGTDMMPTTEIPEYWDYDTAFKADFSTGDTSAGNVNWTVETVSNLLIKRRIKDTFDWTTVDVKKIETLEDFEMNGIDKFNQGNVTYEYALIPYAPGNIAGNYIIEEVDSDFDSIFIIGRDQTFKTFSTDGYIDTTRNIPGSYAVPLNSRYPIFFSNGKMNYDSGNCGGMFFDMDESCELLEDRGYIYKRELMDFITDGRPKLLKHFDGRMWLCQVIPSPTDSADNYYRIRNIAFDWIEIANYRSNKDLYNAGLSDIEEQWWSN